VLYALIEKEEKKGIPITIFASGLNAGFKWLDWETWPRPYNV
jgi:hypothetical protein